MTALKKTKLSIPAITKRAETRLSPWSSVMERTLKMPGKNKEEAYHSLRQADYVSVIAVTQSGRIPLVRQYRPAVEKFTVELPAGLRDGSEPPEQAALRELVEETGLTPLSTPHMLGCLSPDSGRLENKLWGYLLQVSDEVRPDWQPEPGVELVMVSKAELREWILDGTFDHALHIALFAMAELQGVFEWEQ